ncbi:MAG: methionine--tRNA ligase [archaeon]|jgi:methionyl-tRNA synthetase|nr:methionine--tRNA ligase [archaeon]
MAVKKTYYVTTAIDYVNAEPHIGHAYQKVVADVLARWNKLLGKDVFFLTGTDEHGKKIAQSAEKAHVPVEEFVSEMAKKFESAWKKLNIQPDRFIRTTDKDHEETVKEFVEKLSKSKDIYKGHYAGFYCTSCEAYYTEKDLVEGCCPVHKTKIEKLKEETYFFRLSKYQKFLLELYKKNPKFVLPNERRNEIINRVKEGLDDLSITRTSFSWGIPFPLDKKHVIYVWFDALINYYTAINNPKQKKFWPADAHLLGKDNGWFHAVIWPAMLKSAGIEIPKTVFIHGFLTFNGEKISKSLGNVISPIILADRYGADTVRYFALRQVPFGEDGDFSESALIARHNNELADKLGNLVSRVSTLAEKYGLEKAKQAGPLESEKLLKAVSEYLDNFQFDRALNEIFAFIDRCNEHVQKTKPWETKDKKALYQASWAIKDAAILLSPFMPSTCSKIAKTFSFDIDIKDVSKPLKIEKIKKSDILFRKIVIEEKKPESKPIKPQKAHKVEGVMSMSDMIKYDDFAKLDLRIGTIKKVEDIEGADKLYKLEVQIGKENRTILAGIKEHYEKEELKGKQIVVICNLEPRKMRGFVSEGMLLAAVSSDGKKVILLNPEKTIESGSKVQ